MGLEKLIGDNEKTATMKLSIAMHSTQCNQTTNRDFDLWTPTNTTAYKYMYLGEPMSKLYILLV